MTTFRRLSPLHDIPEQQITVALSLIFLKQLISKNWNNEVINFEAFQKTLAW